MFTDFIQAVQPHPIPQHYSCEYDRVSETWMIKEGEMFLGCMFTETYAQAVVNGLNIVRWLFRFTPVAISKTHALN